MRTLRRWALFVVPLEFLGAMVEFFVEVIGRTILLFIAELAVAIATWTGLSRVWDRSHPYVRLTIVAVLILVPFSFAIFHFQAPTHHP